MPSARGPARVHTPTDREQLLCDVASLYYEQNLTQEKIARRVGVTRSMISRLLTEARRRGLVEIHVKRTGARDASLEAALAERFGLKAVAVAASTPASGLDRG
ncbi:MAG: helix-turn-helix domain-containing protein, partial [Chloroflexi bacterium]|nr:helix-turn-helix domain-containing protein [Chloroflexota bacterium]